MNPDADPLIKLQDTLSQGNSGVICLPENPSQDAVAAATSLYIGLTQLGKTVSIACSTPVESDMVGSDKINSQLSASGNNLVISLPYAEGAFEKVDYSISSAGDRFNLIITNSEGAHKIKPEEVGYAYTGGKIGFVITVDAPTLKALGALYTNNQAQFKDTKVVNIDRRLTNSLKAVSSTSEVVLKLLKSLNCEIDRDIASNLYKGLATATNSFTAYSVTADTFEAAAQLLKLGAVKKKMAVNQMTGLEKKTAKPIETVEQEARPGGEDEITPDDWLKPKIFKSGTSMA